MEGPGDVILDLAFGRVAVKLLERKVVVAQDRQTAHVEDRDLGKLQMGLNRMGWLDRRLDGRGVAHLRIAQARRVGAPRGGRRRNVDTAFCCQQRQFRHELTRQGDVGAGDVGMDVDAAGHHDLAGDIISLVGLAAAGVGDDAAVIDENVADRVSIIRRIDDAAALQADQHYAASVVLRRSDRARSTSATVGRPDPPAFAFTMPRPEISAR
ncbi:hypothetical protein A7A08_00618 [Methyloligella halotolerans]|uniref:Uncharacterized protein n=1 Tax=Methyloligella halotolerans TaxID=1177755 RepID=A0A1E2S2W6_9HYPH|nr:hypothetical protein A7A08_00618 [Methyloligella halotolerans]